MDLTGLMFLPGAAVGTLLAGYLIKRLSLSERVLICIKIVFVVTCLSTLLIVIVFVIHCETVPFVGLTVPVAEDKCSVNK